MFEQLKSLTPVTGLHIQVEQHALYYERARYSWLLTRINEMKRLHSCLATEAEHRVSSDRLSWSQMIFTDLFGPDVSIVGALTERLESIETNIVKYRREALDLSVQLNASELVHPPV